MPNRSGKAYGLTVLCPLLRTSSQNQSAAALVRAQLRAQPLDEDSPLASVPNTYLCRLFVLDDVIYQGSPSKLEHLKSQYLVFVAEIHGEPRPYLEGLWQHAQQFVCDVWAYCIGFKSSVHDAASFVRYIERCRVETTFYFNGSTDDPPAEQLKALYLKQELSRFAYANQGKSPVELQRAFAELVARVAPFDTEAPSWAPGASSLEAAERGARPVR